VNRYLRYITIVFPVVLISCQQAGPPLSAVIVTPSRNATVSGTTAVQVSVPADAKVSTVRVYARGTGEKGQGVLLGSANTAPYVISWATGSTPAGDGLEVYAVASGAGSTDGTSDAVPVRVSNPDAPALNYLVTYNLPVSVQGVVGVQSLKASRLPRLDAALVQQTGGIRPQSVSPLADPVPAEPRDLAVEWAWSPAAGANGYDVLLSKTSLAGPYEVVRSQVAVPTGVQKHSQSLSAAKPGDLVYGAVATLSNNAQDRSSFSNAGAAGFLQTQQSASPADKQTVQDGRPILSWPALSGADAYLYFLCDKVCSAQDAKDLWTNYPKAQSTLSAFYPANLKALPSGTYFWWVAGVKFNTQGQAVAFSYSVLRTLVVP
jgi:Bacterial Ig domain